jgi:small subunit ribosomal protein S17
MSKKVEVKKKLLYGVVVAKKMAKTVTVFIERVFINKLVGKVVKVKKKYHVNDPESVCAVGDKIAFYEGRPVSKTKYMHFHSVVPK